jgi:hypothetical protein
MHTAAQLICHCATVRLHPYLRPYLDPARSPSLIEVVLYKKRNVELRFSDGNSVFLDFQSKIVRALELLEAAKEQWQQQDESDGSSESDADDLLLLGDSRSEFANGSLQHSASILSSLSLRKTTANGAAASSRSRAVLGPNGDMFRSDERLGVPSTLHRIAAMRNLNKEVIGLTYRIGRHVPGVGMLLGDLLSAMKASLQSNRWVTLHDIGLEQSTQPTAPPYHPICEH